MILPKTKGVSKMYINENGKFTSRAEYFYNEHIGMYCIIGTTLSSDDLDVLMDLFETPDLLVEVPMPGYVTSDEYDEAEW